MEVKILRKKKTGLLKALIADLFENAAAGYEKQKAVSIFTSLVSV